jgi:hypothetical protein
LLTLTHAIRTSEGNGPAALIIHTFIKIAAGLRTHRTGGTQKPRGEFVVTGRASLEGLTPPGAIGRNGPHLIASGAFVRRPFRESPPTGVAPDSMLNIPAR